MWILVVEDEPAMAQMLSQGLEEENHTVTVATNGGEALAVAASTTFDVIVLDVMMPAPDGIEVARRIRKSGNHVPIIMLTARDADADIVKGLDAGSDDYLVKPSLSVCCWRISGRYPGARCSPHRQCSVWTT